MKSADIFRIIDKIFPDPMGDCPRWIHIPGYAGSGDYNWYKLYGSNGSGGYSHEKIPVKKPDGTTVIRGGFNLHTGLASNGCVTVKSDVDAEDPSYPHSKNYDKLKKMLNSTKMFVYKNTEFTGWLEVK